MKSLDEAVAAAFDSASLTRATVNAACLGLAGADRESDRSVVELWAQEVRLARFVRVVNDALPLLYTDSMTGCGVALIAGTGSLALGVNSSGQIARSGGWGYLFGDEGSAFAIGRSVLQAVSRAEDGRAPGTRLLDYVLKHLQVTSTREIVTAVYSNEMPRAVVAGLAPIAFESAEARDKIALEIVAQAASDLAAMVVSVAKRLQLRRELHLALSGSVLLQQASFRDSVLLRIRDGGAELQSTFIVRDAVAGAVAIAQSMCQTATPEC